MSNLTLEGQAEYEEWYDNFEGIIDAEIAWHASRELWQKRIAELEDGMKTISKIKELKGDPYLSLNLVIDIANEVLSEGGADE